MPNSNTIMVSKLECCTICDQVKLLSNMNDWHFLVKVKSRNMWFCQNHNVTRKASLSIAVKNYCYKWENSIVKIWINLKVHISRWFNLKVCFKWNSWQEVISLTFKLKYLCSHANISKSGAFIIFFMSSIWTISFSFAQAFFQNSQWHIFILKTTKDPWPGPKHQCVRYYPESEPDRGTRW